MIWTTALLSPPRLGRVACPATEAAKHPALRNLWARRKISELAMQSLLSSETDTIPGAIKDVALDHGLMSAYTAFVAVDASGTVADPSLVTLPVPVSVPHGVRHDTTLE